MRRYRFLLIAAGIVGLWPPLAHSFWMPGNGPCAWMAGGMVRRAFGGGYDYPPPWPPAVGFPPPVFVAPEPPPAPVQGIQSSGD